jgi:hypothetical protein
VHTPRFARSLGIDYSGAETPTSSLSGLRIFRADHTSPGSLVEVLPPPGPKKYWTRRGVAERLVEQLGHRPPVLVGIDHAFSFPLHYFEKHGIPHDWPTFLDDFHRHWPTDSDNLYVDFVRDGLHGDGAARTGSSRWKRLCEKRAAGAPFLSDASVPGRRAGPKSVFHFDVPGSVAKSTHAGLPWLRFLRASLGTRVHFWPFDGWQPPADRSVIAEVYPSLWSRRWPRKERTPDQHDAYCVARALRDADRGGLLVKWLEPKLTPAERTLAGFEGWILGVP